MTPQTLRVGGRIVAGATRLDPLISALRPLMDDPSITTRLDLSELQFIGPTGLAILAATCGVATGIVEVVPPSDAGVAAYLARMDAVGAEGDSQTAGRHQTRRAPLGFRECCRFSSLEECVSTSRSMVAAIEERRPLDGDSRNHLTSCIAELAENVVFHAATGHGYAAAQSWPKKGSIEVGIVDLGRGIRASLRENATYGGIDTDEEAIRRALSLGVTATPERNSGQGLFTAARLLQGNGGRILVRSGEAHVWDGASQRSGAALDFPGTLVSLTIKLDRPLDGAAVARLIGTLTGADEDDDDLFD